MPGKYACYEINLHKSNIAIDEKIIGKYFSVELRDEKGCVEWIAHEGSTEVNDDVALKFKICGDNEKRR